jgi:hypothetical protein
VKIVRRGVDSFGCDVASAYSASLTIQPWAARGATNDGNVTSVSRFVWNLSPTGPQAVPFFGATPVTGVDLDRLLGRSLSLDSGIGSEKT